jgi:hypothetical protein
MTVSLAPEVRDALAEQFTTCLCPRCLEESWTPTQTQSAPGS